MATADKKSLFVGGGNGAPISPTGNAVTDLERAQDVARRYRCEFVDLSNFELHHELFKILARRTRAPFGNSPHRMRRKRSRFSATLLSR